jgi:hypothetical protein
MQLNETKEKIEKLRKKINKKKLDIISLEDELKVLKKNKEIKENELENLLSNKESLEEILRVLINDILKINNQRYIYNDIDIGYDEILNCPIDKLNEQIKTIFQELKVNNIGKINEVINKNLKNKNIIKNENIDLFLSEIIQSIKNIINEDKINEEQLFLLIKHIIKIVYLEQKIQDTFIYLTKEYQDKKKEIQDKITETITLKEILEEKILESNFLIEELENKIDLLDKKSRNMGNIKQNKYKKNLYLTKENDFDLICNTYNPNFRKSLNSTTKTTSRGNNNNVTYENNQILKTTPISTTSRLKNINQYNNEINQIDESFCYFKILNKYEGRFNPINELDKTPEFYGYHKGLISIDFINKLLLLIESKNENNVLFNKDNSLQLNFNQLSNIIILNFMKEIIKVYILFLRYNNKCQKESSRKIRSLNKFIHLKELNNINMNDNHKIKSAMCKYFTFSILLNEGRYLEIIFLNYDDFKNWFDGLSLIVNGKKIINNENMSKNNIMVNPKEDTHYKLFRPTNQTSQHYLSTNF